MANTIYDTYLETEVFGADPVKLIHMLYRGAIEAVGAARRHLAAKQIRERSRQVNKAWNILHELSRSLDFNRGGEIARSLGELYNYMQRRLIEANAQQSDAPLAEVESLLNTLCEAWQPSKCSPAPPVAESAYEPVSCSY
jgi:flagellar secretion chaperone FliS